MQKSLKVQIQDLAQVSESRKNDLTPLISYIRKKRANAEAVNLNFICTHNSRRSHLSQIWAQTMAFYFKIDNLFCYSGGTEETALYPKVADTLKNQGFTVLEISEGKNPIYAIKFAENAPAIICFSKKYDHPFNPSSNFAAVMTCDNADQGCPFVAGADGRFPVKYRDPKVSDGTPSQDEVYRERSLEIASEMYYIFSQVAE